MKVKLTIENVDYYDLMNALKSCDLDRLLSLKKCNNKSNKPLGFGRKVKKLLRAQNLPVRMHE